MPASGTLMKSRALCWVAVARLTVCRPSRNFSVPARCARFGHFSSLALANRPSPAMYDPDAGPTPFGQRALAACEPKDRERQHQAYTREREIPPGRPFHLAINLLAIHRYGEAQSPRT